MKFLFLFTVMQVSMRVNPFNYLGKAFSDLSVIFPHAIFRVRKSSYIQCFNSILSFPSTKFNLGLLIFIDVAFFYTVHVIFFYIRTIMFYTTMCNLSWTPHSSLEKDNSLNHSCVSPTMGCLEYITKN